MDEKRDHIIKLADGTEIDCILNGNNYITDHKVSEDSFSDEVIANVEVDGIKSSNRVLRNFRKEDDGYHIVFGELTYDEKVQRSIESKIEYLALMSDVDLEGATNE